MLLSLATASFGPTRRTGSRQQEAAGDCEYGGCRTEEEEARPWAEEGEGRQGSGLVVLGSIEVNREERWRLPFGWMGKTWWISRLAAGRD